MGQSNPHEKINLAPDPSRHDGHIGTGRTTQMRRMSMPVLRAVIAVPLLSAGAHAATRLPSPPPAPITRTYVSGTGNDSSPCTASQPCATFQAALALTLAGGEIFVLNSADYGPVTINKAVSITSEGAAGGIFSNNGAGLTHNAGGGGGVNPRGLPLAGAEAGATGGPFLFGHALTI